MNPYRKFILIALACLLVGVPLWTLVLAPSEFSPTMVLDPGFWIAVVAGFAILLFGFWIGERTDTGE